MVWCLKALWRSLSLDGCDTIRVFDIRRRERSPRTRRPVFRANWLLSCGTVASPLQIRMANSSLLPTKQGICVFASLLQTQMNNQQGWFATSRPVASQASMKQGGRKDLCRLLAEQLAHLPRRTLFCVPFASLFTERTLGGHFADASRAPGPVFDLPKLCSRPQPREGWTSAQALRPASSG